MLTIQLHIAKPTPSLTGSNIRALLCRWGNAGTVAPGPGAYDQSTLSMQKEVEKMTTNTARHGAFGMGERFVKPKQPDSAAVSYPMSQLICADLFWSSRTRLQGLLTLIKTIGLTFCSSVPVGYNYSLFAFL